MIPNIIKTVPSRGLVISTVIFLIYIIGDLISIPFSRLFSNESLSEI